MRDIIFIGDGLGVRTYVARCLGLNAIGTDISKWALDHSYIKDRMILDDISQTKLTQLNEVSKVMVLYDILEHLDDNQLNNALESISKIGSNFVFSLPFAPHDSNLYNDKTHKQFKTKEEWVKLIESYKIKIKETPSEWLFKDQILIGIKEDG